ncbi:hypothetical protein GIB67_040061, partial [Kingdonia uniflora]
SPPRQQGPLPGTPWNKRNKKGPGKRPRPRGPIHRPANTHYAFPVGSITADSLTPVLTLLSSTTTTTSPTSLGSSEPTEMGHSSSDSSGWHTPSHDELFDSDTGTMQTSSHSIPQHSITPSQRIESYMTDSRKRSREILTTTSEFGDSGNPAKVLIHLRQRTQKRPKLSQFSEG